DSEGFAGLLLRYRGRTHLTQAQLAARTGVHVRSVQSWEAGISYPSADRLQALIAALLQTGGLIAGREAAEAEALWRAVLLEAPRMSVPFDSWWFDALVSGPSASSSRVAEPAYHPDGFDAVARVQHREDWAD